MVLALALALMMGACLSLLLSEWLSEDVFSPLGMYGAVWLAALAVYSVPIIELTPVTNRGWCATIGSLAAFLMAALIAGLPYRHALAGTDRDWSADSVQVDAQRLLRAVAGTFLISVIGYVLYLQRVAAVLGSASAVWQNPRMILWHGVYGELRRLGLVGVMIGFFIPCFVLASYYVIKFRRAPPFVLLVLATCLAVTALSPSRTQWMTLASWVFFLAASMRSTQRAQAKFVVYSMLLLIMLVAVFVISSRALQKLEYRGQPGVWYHTQLRGFWTWTLSPYLYIAGNFPALGQVLSEPPPYTHGAATFAPLQRLGHMVAPDIFAYPEAVGPDVDIPFAFNTYTYLREFYLDFGWLGIFLFPFLIGLISNLLYVAMRLRPTFFRQWVNSLVLVCLVSTFNVNRFAWIATWQQALIGLPVAWYVERRCQAGVLPCRRHDSKHETANA